MRILHLEDGEDDRRIFELLMKTSDGGVEVIGVATLKAALAFLREEKNAIDVVVSDLFVSDAVMLGAVDQLHDVAPKVPLLVYTGLSDEAMLVEAVKRGADDVCIKSELTARALWRQIQICVTRRGRWST